MRTWTTHLRDGAEPVLVREGLAWGAFWFGPLWLAAHRAWVPAALSVAAYALLLVLVPVLAHGAVAAVLASALAWLHLVSGQDMVRWGMTQRGFQETSVVIARTEGDALARLLAERPELIGRFG
jgi:hypothetical protein